MDIIVRDIIVGKDVTITSNLTKVTTEQIKKGRCKAYKYLI